MRVRTPSVCFGILVTLNLLVGCFDAAYARSPMVTPPPAPGAPGASPPAAARCPAGRPLALDTRQLSPYVYRGGDGRTYVDIWIQACGRPVARRRQPLDIAVVLDTSGSMAGAKIQRARAAAQYLLNSLGPYDRMSVVTYNTNVAIQFPLTAVTPRNRAWMSGRIAGIYPSGLTNLGGGLQQGLRQLGLGGGGRERVARVILISDGLANVGLTAPASLHSLAARAHGRRAAITTMGVGQHFNEILMQNLAEHGGGRYHYIANATGLTGIFGRELKTVRSLVATQITIQLQLCRGCRVVSAPGYAVRQSGTKAFITVSDLAGGERRKAMVQIALPRAMPSAQKVHVELSYRGLRAKRRLTQKAALRWSPSATAARVKRSTDKRVASRLVWVRANLMTQKAMSAYQAGRTAAATTLMNRAQQSLRRHARRTRSAKARRTFTFEADNIRGSLSRMRAAPRPSSARGRHLQKARRKRAFDNLMQ